MIVDCISDLHGHYPKLEGGDLLIVAGDLTAKDTFEQHCDFKTWLYKQDYRKKIVIAGNHDNHFVGLPSDPYIFSSYNSQSGEQLSFAEYLCDSGTEFEGLKIWGSPWTLKFPGMNPKCKAFTCDTEEELQEKWVLIPNDVDILITHSPPYGIMDCIIKDLINSRKCIPGLIHCGSKTLSNRMEKFPRPRLHVFGHIHEFGGKQKKYGSNTIMINASHVNERYQPVNKPVRVIL